MLYDVLEWSERLGWRTIRRGLSYERAERYARQYPRYSVSPSL